MLQHLLLLSILPSISISFLFGNQCNQCSQPSYQQQPYYPQPQPQYYPQQQQYQQPQYQQPPQPQYYPPQQQGYVVPPRPQQPYHHPSPIYRNPLRQYNIPEAAYGSPPGYKPTVTRPSLSRSGYGDNEFLGEGTISVRPSAEGERATYIMNRHGANSLIVHGQEPVRTLAPPPSISQPMVDEVVVEANAPARQSVQVISESQPVHRVEKLYRPVVHQVEPSVDPTPTYLTPTPTYSPAPVYEPHVVESTSEFRGVEPAAPSPPSYPIEQQGYDSSTEAPIVPYEPATTPYSPPVQVQPSNGYDSVKRFAGFEHEDQLRASGLARRAAV